MNVAVTAVMCVCVTESLNVMSALSDCHSMSYDNVAAASHTAANVVFVNSLMQQSHKPPLLSPKRISK